MNVPTYCFTALLHNPRNYGRNAFYYPYSGAPYVSAMTGGLWTTIGELETHLFNLDITTRSLAPREYVLRYMTDSAASLFALQTVQCLWEQKVERREWPAYYADNTTNSDIITFDVPLSEV
jgi:hypothetical protein